MLVNQVSNMAPKKSIPSVSLDKQDLLELEAHFMNEDVQVGCIAFLPDDNDNTMTKKYVYTDHGNGKCSWVFNGTTPMVDVQSMNVEIEVIQSIPPKVNNIQQSKPSTSNTTVKDALAALDKGNHDECRRILEALTLAGAVSEQSNSTKKQDIKDSKDVKAGSGKVTEYHKFMSTMMQQLAKTHPTLTFKERVTEISTMWKTSPSNPKNKA